MTKDGSERPTEKEFITRLNQTYSAAGFLPTYRLCEECCCRFLISLLFSWVSLWVNIWIQHGFRKINLLFIHFETFFFSFCSSEIRLCAALCSNLFYLQNHSLNLKRCGSSLQTFYKTEHDLSIPGFVLWNQPSLDLWALVGIWVNNVPTAINHYPLDMLIIQWLQQNLRRARWGKLIQNKSLQIQNIQSGIRLRIRVDVRPESLKALCDEGVRNTWK